MAREAYGELGQFPGNMEREGRKLASLLLGLCSEISHAWNPFLSMYIACKIDQKMMSFLSLLVVVAILLRKSVMLAVRKHNMTDF